MSRRRRAPPTDWIMVLLWILITILLAFAALLSCEARASDYHVAAPKHVPLYADSARLPDGVLRYRYDDAGEIHPWAHVIVASAMAEWAHACGIRFEHVRDGARFAWPVDMPINVGAWTLADIGPTGIEHVAVEFNAAALLDLPTLYHVARHEIGHAIGLAHSDVDGAVMSGPPFTQYNIFAPRLTADDIAGCVALYGMPQ